MDVKDFFVIPRREGEREQVERDYVAATGIRLVVVDAAARFLDELAGVSDPETKRKTIGRLFIDVFDKESARIEGAAFLAQGTLYPDVIESVSFTGGPSVTIKSHHNVGGLPAELGFELVEPLRDLGELGGELDPHLPQILQFVLVVPDQIGVHQRLAFVSVTTARRVSTSIAVSRNIAIGTGYLKLVLDNFHGSMQIGRAHV